MKHVHPLYNLLPVQRNGYTTLRIPEGFQGEPIELLLGHETPPLHVCIEKGAKVELFLFLVTRKKDISHKQQIELSIANDAIADVTLLENCTKETTVSIHQRSTLGTNAEVHFHIVTLGGKQVEHDLVSRVVGAKSVSSIDWIFYGKDEEKQKLSARNVFDAKNGSGEITVQGIAEGRAHTEFNGMIDITKNGTGTNTYLTETTLMLDPTAKVDAVPALEIKTNDVKASHSATVTKVSEADLFYFASRGIPEVDARRMYIEGFLGALTARIPSEKVRTLVQREIREKYEDL